MKTKKIKNLDKFNEQGGSVFCAIVNGITGQKALYIYYAPKAATRYKGIARGSYFTVNPVPAATPLRGASVDALFLAGSDLTLGCLGCGADPGPGTSDDEPTVNTLKRDANGYTVYGFPPEYLGKPEFESLLSESFVMGDELTYDDIYWWQDHAAAIKAVAAERPKAVLSTVNISSYARAFEGVK